MLGIYPNCFQLKIGLGHCYYNTLQNFKAEQKYKQAKTLNPTSYISYECLVNLYRQRFHNDFKAGLQAEKCLQINPKSITSLLSKLNLLLFIQINISFKTQQYTQIANQTCAQFPDQPLFLELTIKNLNEKQKQMKLLHYRKIASQHFQPYAKLYQLYLKKNKMALALECKQKLNQLFPKKQILWQFYNIGSQKPEQLFSELKKQNYRCDSYFLLKLAMKFHCQLKKDICNMFLNYVFQNIYNNSVRASLFHRYINKTGHIKYQLFQELINYIRQLLILQLKTKNILTIRVLYLYLFKFKNIYKQIQQSVQLYFKQANQLDFLQVIDLELVFYEINAKQYQYKDSHINIIKSNVLLYKKQKKQKTLNSKISSILNQLLTSIFIIKKQRQLLGCQSRYNYLLLMQSKHRYQKIWQCKLINQ